MKLYEIDAAIAALVDEDTGEVRDYKTFENLAAAREVKIENLALYIKNAMSNAREIRAEEKALESRRHAIESGVERLKDYLKNALDGEKFMTPRVSVGWRASEEVIIHNPEALNAWIKADPEREKYIAPPEPPRYDRMEIKRAIRDGKNLPGAALVRKNNPQIK
jgi:hypothetical protein